MRDCEILFPSVSTRVFVRDRLTGLWMYGWAWLTFTFLTVIEAAGGKPRQPDADTKAGMREASLIGWVEQRLEK